MRENNFMLSKNLNAGIFIIGLNNGIYKVIGG